MAARRKSPATRVAGKPILVEQILSEVQKALQNAQGKINDPDFPELESVVVTLLTAITMAGGGKIKFLIFSFGMSWEKETSQELVYSLVPPPAGPKMASVADQLTDAIVDAAEGVKKAKTGKPPLVLDRFNALVAFLVIEEVSGSGEFKLQPVTLELSGKLKRKALHKIELKFKQK